MSNLTWAMLPFALLAILYVLILTRKGEAKRLGTSLGRHDWVTFLAAIMGGTILSSSSRAIGISDEMQPVFTVIVFGIVAVVILVVVMRIRSRKPIVQPMGDERVVQINAKSARNALLATYAVLFAHNLITDANTLDEKWLFLLVAAGLGVLIVSGFFYYYFKAT